MRNIFVHRIFVISDAENISQVEPEESIRRRAGTLKGKCTQAENVASECRRRLSAQLQQNSIHRTINRQQS